jgi:ADP-heptose:LPS heptosyltransferase
MNGDGFRGDRIYSTPQIHFVLTNAALGDMLCSLPAIAYARLTVAPEQKFTVWVPEHQVPLVECLLGRLDNLRILPLHEFDPKTPGDKAKGYGPEWMTPGMAVVNYFVQGQATRNKCNMVDFSYLCLLDRLPRSDAEREYPHKVPLGPRPWGSGPYVVISVEATSDNKIIPEHVLEGVIRWLSGEGYCPVIIGKRETMVKCVGEDKPLVMRNRFDNLSTEVRGLCLDLRDKTTLLEARDWCGHAEAVLGVDGGLLHLAGTTNAPIVYGYTHINPLDRGIVRFGQKNWNLVHVGPRDLACTGCQGNMQLMLHHDFRFCIYKDNLCVDRLHPDDFINALRTLGLGG